MSTTETEVLSQIQQIKEPHKDKRENRFFPNQRTKSGDSGPPPPGGSTTVFDKDDAHKKGCCILS